MMDLGIYRHRIVRDLAWSLVSPPLIEPRHRGAFWPPAAWYRARYAEYAPTLAVLDRDPGTLVQAVSSRAGPTLGSYFEALLGFWLSTTPRFRLLARNLTVRSGARTVGEFDLLATDTADQHTWHIEVAVKFYLGLPGVSGGARAHWRGVHPADRLDRKVDHLRRHQTRLAKQPAACRRLADLGIRPDGVMALVKGRLFYPYGARQARYRAPAGACPAHLHGVWYTPTEFVATFRSTAIRWSVPARRGWLAPHLPSDEAVATMTVETLVDRIEGEPVLAIGLDRGVEVQRCFVVPDGWPNT